MYAEDPQKYLPSIGRLSTYIEPTGPGVRCDSGIVEGSEISVHYDPMICKLVTGGADRQEARTRMESALDEYVIKGVTHNIPLLRDVVSHKRFIKGNLTTKFLAEEYPKGFQGRDFTADDLTQLAAVVGAVNSARRDVAFTWLHGGGAFGNDLAECENELWVNVGDRDPVLVSVVKQGDSLFSAQVDGKQVSVELDWPLESSLVRARINHSHNIVCQYLQPLPLGYQVSFYGTRVNVGIKTPRQFELGKFIKEKPKMDLSRVILSPMLVLANFRPGTLVSVSVAVGDVVAEGAEIAVVEAMKMQNVLRAPRVGKVKAVLVKAGQSVGGDEVLVELE